MQRSRADSLRAKDELDTYPSTTAKGLGAEHRIQNPNTEGTASTTMTTGRYTPNPFTDDVLVRWNDGHTSMFTDTTLTHLNTEHILVAAGT